MHIKAQIILFLCLAAGVAAVAMQPPAETPARKAAARYSAPPPGALREDAAPITPVPAAMVNPDKARLGEKLFRDPRLSHHQNTSCASCHDLARGGADGKPRPTLYDQSLSKVNTPSVFNAALQPYFFWDGSVRSLEAQVEVDLTKHMGADWETLIPLLNKDPVYAAAFRRLYPGGMSANAVVNAIAEFERTLLTPNSRFDRFLRGETQAISAEEQQGYRLFMNYGCINCHQGVNLGGNMFERLGVVYPVAPVRQPPRPRDDIGRFKVTGQEKHRHYFRVPGLRNVEKTAPYFHDGSITRLEDAVRIMGYYNLGASLPNEDVHLITGFLKTLTGEPPRQP